MDPYQEDLDELRSSFARVNTKSPDELRQWFHSIPHLTVADLQALTGAEPKTIRRWRRLAGLPAAPGGSPHSATRYIPTPALAVPDDWNNQDWLTYAYQITGSIRQVAALVGRDYRTIYDKFVRHQIPLNRDLRRPHPYRNRQWLREHYVLRKLSQDECARRAGICRTTLVGWLVEFKIAVRTTTETSASRRVAGPMTICLWGRELCQKLRALPLVTRVRVRERGLIVNYRSHVKEVYWFCKPETRRRAFQVNKKDSRLRHIPTVYEQYPAPFGASQYPAHLVIQRSDWEQASVVEQRVALHTMLAELRKRRWQQPRLPAAVVQADLDAIYAIPVGAHLRKHAFLAYPVRGQIASPGWALLMHYFNLDEHFNPVWGSPLKLYGAMRDVSNSTRLLCTTEIIRSASFRYGPQFIPPGLWVEVLRQLKVTGTVLDLNPGYGGWAIACAVLGVRYRTAPHAGFEAAVSAGIGEFLGLNWEPDTGGRVGLVVGNDVNAALGLAGRAGRVAALIPHTDLKATVEQYRPGSVLRVRTRLRSQRDDYLALW